MWQRLVRQCLWYVLRAYAWTITTKVWRWLANERPDVILEPLPTPDDDVPEYHDQCSVYLSRDQRTAYTADHNGTTLRRCAVDADTGDLVYTRKADKQQRRASKRAKRRNAHS